jgi:hypothetical protein
MTEKNWQAIKICYCQHIGSEVALEAELIFPPEHLPDSGPRVGAHRCSQGLNCNLDGRPSCIWAGTNPTVEPFSEGL